MVIKGLIFHFTKYYHVCFLRYWRKTWEYNGSVHHLFIDFKNEYDSVRRVVLYNIHPEFDIPMKLQRLIKPFLREICTVLEPV
jgi:hypothetical protein